MIALLENFLQHKLNHTCTSESSIRVPAKTWTGNTRNTHACTYCIHVLIMDFICIANVYMNIQHTHILTEIQTSGVGSNFIVVRPSQKKQQHEINGITLHIITIII